MDVYVSHVCLVPTALRRGLESPGTGVTEDCEPLRGCWKPQISGRASSAKPSLKNPVLFWSGFLSDGLVVTYLYDNPYSVQISVGLSLRLELSCLGLLRAGLTGMCHLSSLFCLFLSFYICLFYFMYMMIYMYFTLCVWPACIWSTMCVPGANRGQKRAPDPLELQLLTHPCRC